jgi:hypothetical protein
MLARMIIKGDIEDGQKVLIDNDSNSFTVIKQLD